MLDAFERRRQVQRAFLGRISIDPADRGHASYVNLELAGYHVRIMLDDVEQIGCLTADPEEGSITRYRMVKGRPLYANGVAQIETVKGSVRIKLEPKATLWS